MYKKKAYIPVSEEERLDQLAVKAEQELEGGV